MNYIGKYITKDGAYWSSSEGYEDEVYLLNLELGTIEAYPMFDDGEEDDNVLRLIGHIFSHSIT